MHEFTYNIYMKFTDYNTRAFNFDNFSEFQNVISDRLSTRGRLRTQIDM